MSRTARFLENVFVVLSSHFTWWEMVGEEPSRGHQRTGPTEEGKGANTADRPSLRRGRKGTGQAVSLSTILPPRNSQGSH